MTDQFSHNSPGESLQAAGADANSPGGGGGGGRRGRRRGRRRGGQGQGENNEPGQAAQPAQGGRPHQGHQGQRHPNEPKQGGGRPPPNNNNNANHQGGRQRDDQRPQRQGQQGQHQTQAQRQSGGGRTHQGHQSHQAKGGHGNKGQKQDRHDKPQGGGNKNGGKPEVSIAIDSRLKPEPADFKPEPFKHETQRYDIVFYETIAAAKADVDNIKKRADAVDQLNLVIKAEGGLNDPDLNSLPKVKLFTGAAWTLIHERRVADGWYEGPR